jgi:hypothetical protein
LKDVLAQLNTSVAINTEATKGRKEVVEKEFNRHNDDRKPLDSRVTIVEARLDTIDVKMAASDGRSAGEKWAIGIALLIGTPCIGYVVAAVLNKLFGFPV